MRRSIGFFLATTGIVCVLGIGADRAQAQAVLDQVYDPPQEWTEVFRLDRSLAQTFTAGISGQLTQVDLRVAWKRVSYASAADLVIDVRQTDDNGYPIEDDGAALASVTIAADDVPEAFDDYSPIDALLSVDISSADVQVNAGDKLAIVIRAPDSVISYRIGGRDSDPRYDGGESFIRAPGIGIPMWEGDSEGYPGDFVFRTWVDAPIQAIPQSWGSLKATYR